MKRLFLFLLLISTGLFGFSQKGKVKAKGKKKAETTVPAPAPGNTSATPEVKQKQLPQVYDKPTDGGTTGQTGSGTQTKDTVKNVDGVSTSADGGGKPTPGVGPVNGGVTTAPTSTETKPMTNETSSGTGDGKPEKNMKGEKGNKGNKGEKGDKEKKEHDADDDDDDNDNGKGNSKERNNVPAQVQKSFVAEYPRASNTVWTKQNGEWTVNFNNNGTAAIASYHSNGEKSSGTTPGGKKREVKVKKSKG